MARKVSKEDLRIKKEKIVQGVGGVSILQMEINIKTYHHFPEFVHKLHLIKSNSPLPAGNISPSTIRCLLLEILCLFTILPQRNVFSVRTQISMPHPYYSRILGRYEPKWRVSAKLVYFVIYENKLDLVWMIYRE